jgi:hypothetical protein
MRGVRAADARQLEQQGAVLPGTRSCPGRRRATCRPGREAARPEIVDCDASLRQHRAALEAGASPEIVTAWINETQAKRAAAEARLRQGASGRRRITREEITSLVNALGDLMTVLTEADPADMAEVYQQLGLTLTYDPAAKRVKAEARPESIMYVRECPRGDSQLTSMTPVALATEFAVGESR